MATSKPKGQPVKPDAEEAIESAINKTEEFLFTNGKTLLTFLAAIVLIVGGYFGYKHLYAQPRDAKAADMMFVAEQQFAADSYELALNGDGDNAGFLQVIERYKGSAPGNLACHYAGICYIKLGDLEQAEAYLARYKPRGKTTALIINAQNLGLRGDLKVQKGDLKGALELYTKAIAAAHNSLTSPAYLKKAGLVCEKLGNKAKALELYNRIVDEFGASLEARDIDKSIGRVEQ